MIAIFFEITSYTNTRNSHPFQTNVYDLQNHYPTVKVSIPLVEQLIDICSAFRRKAPETSASVAQKKITFVFFKACASGVLPHFLLINARENFTQDLFNSTSHNEFPPTYITSFQCSCYLILA